ncbi:hypothetical protein G6011_11345 [Alternaria panax]|uniref:Extracellular mutant protein 11 C-terminal domain-containing protein n=1 Tax=Alternaria panax TaxID=48097 RepID=A0AAD4ID87_9PLEO|nr:hypothetical protein G6011_11345 [Alternaria panax]
MDRFVHGRTGSPSNGPSQGKPDRQANAASARVPVKNGHPRMQSQVPSGTQVRGSTNAQNSSASLQQPLPRRQSGLGQSQKRDPYDTDAESIDTTVYQSVVQVEDSQQKEPHHQQQGQVVDDEESSEGEDEDEADGDRPEEPQYPYYYHGYKLTQEDEEYFHQGNLGNLSYADKISFLQQAELRGLPTVDGDSYPSTTNGELSEWEVKQEAASHFHEGGSPVSPSPQRQNVNNQTVSMVASQLPPQQQSQNMPVSSHRMPKPSPYFQHSAQIRDESRAAPPTLQGGSQNIERHASTSPLVSQQQPNNRNKLHPTASFPVHSNPYSGTYAQRSRSQQKSTQEAFGPQMQIPPNQNTLSIGPPAPLRCPPPVPAIQEPIVQKQPIEQTRVEGLEDVSHEDYDQKTLLKMKYKELKDEPFDLDPRAPPPMLADEELQKPLVERLPLVQKNLDMGQQTQFFRSLPTTEWEDAGDWFLDQFQDIIQRTKQARQKKRKLAQEFEAEVEKRYDHLSKKQQQVQEAMDKMKEQGEGLVPRSPRPSKSPRPKRG